MLEEVGPVKLSKDIGHSEDRTAKIACDLCMVIARGWSQQGQAGTMRVGCNPLGRSGKNSIEALSEASCSN